MATMTIGGWMVYALAISLLAASAAWLAERGLARLGLPTRWVWLGALFLCVAVPLVGAVGARGGDSGVTLTIPAVDLDLTGASSAPELGSPGEWWLAVLGDAVARWRHALDQGVAAAASLASGEAGSASGRALGAWLGGLWAVASLALGLLLLVSAARLYAKVRRWPRARVLDRDVRLSPLLGPATVGLRRPEIVIPVWARDLPARELALVLMHEEEHVRMRDPLLLALGLVAAVACPWNPLLWWQQRRLKDAVEVDCDRRVIAGGAGVSSYGELLVRIGSRSPRGPLPVPTMTGSVSLLGRRLTALKKTRLRRALPGALGTFAASLTLIALACGTEPPAATSVPADLDAQAAEVARNELVADLWVEPDGSVFINDERHAMEEVSDVVGALQAASSDPLVVSVAGDPAVPYRVMDALQREVLASGASRVSFAAAESRPLPTPPGDPADVLGGIGLALPEQGEAVRVSVRNVLHLLVEPSGAIAVRRGEAASVERIRPSDVESLWGAEVANNPNLIAAVRTHPDARYADMIAVLDALHRANAQRISIQTLEN
jgi:beta-lactamase regulating signal transducer with metallopeptidase domain/biopolymer transport protein ExbD